MSDSVRPHRRQSTRLRRPWDSSGKNSGVGCHFLLQCMKVKSESEVAQLCPTPSNPMDCSLPGSSAHGSELPCKRDRSFKQITGQGDTFTSTPSISGRDHPTWSPFHPQPPVWPRSHLCTIKSEQNLQRSPGYFRKRVSCFSWLTTFCISLQPHLLLLSCLSTCGSPNVLLCQEHPLPTSLSG